MQPGQLLYRAANWLAKDDNAFYVLLWTMCPPLLAIILLGWF